MLQERAIQIRVGIFVTAGLILACMIIFMLGSERAWFQRKYELRCRFADASGLLVGASVHLVGVKIGAVSGINFSDSADQKDIEVVLKIGKSYQDRIRKDSVAAIHTQGLLGDKFINITMGSATEPVLNSGETIKSSGVTGLGTLISRGEVILDEVENTASLIKDFISDRSPDSIAHTLFYDPRGKEIISDLAAGARSFRSVLGGVDARKVMDNLEKSSEDIRAVTAQIRRGEGTLGALLTDTSIYNDLRSLFGRVNRNVLLRSIVRTTLHENERKAVER